MQLAIDLPAWIDELDRPRFPVEDGHDAPMAWVLDVLDRQIDEGTGGPFAAAVVDGDGTVLSVGVNRVVPDSACVAHAETLAFALAGQAVGRFSLAGRGARLYTSTEPCAMCLGATVWSGVDVVVTAAAGADAVAIGFDEGDKFSPWHRPLTSRGIEVVSGLHRERGAAALRRYVEVGGLVYNGAAD